jgi:peptide/nickel transport system ATP-binding protein/oligopeptide transport system ATP-binding protein
MGGQEDAPLLSIEGLTVQLRTPRGPAFVPADLSLAVPAAGSLGIVGESGSGKSMTLRAVLGLLPGTARVLGGRITWRGHDLLADRARLQQVRGREIGMIFQDPGASLDPVRSIGAQLDETVSHLTEPRGAALRARSLELLTHVGIPQPEVRRHAYPHQLSGGLRQRAMIAMAIAAGPALLLADEPTTALDVTIQDQILALLERLRAGSGMALVLVSHDLGVIARACDVIAVMYAGRVVELGPADVVLRTPRHPYTRALVTSVPRLLPEPGRSLVPIAGQPPDIARLPPGSAIAPRCPAATPACASVAMQLDHGRGRSRSACPVVR